MSCRPKPGPRFEMTREGYLLAREYLKQVGKWDSVKGEDGFTVVYYANQIVGNSP